MLIFLLENYFKVGHHGSKFLKQSPSILLNVDTWWFAHIRLGERWHGNHFSRPFGIGNHNHIKYQTWIIHYIQTSHQSSSASLISLLLCWSTSYMYYYYVFFSVCRAPNRAPMRVFFFCGLSCTKSCSNACFFSRFVVHQIVFYFVVPGLVCLLGNCCWWFLWVQSSMKVLTIGSGTDKTWGLVFVFWIDFFVHQMVLKSVLFLR